MEQEVKEHLEFVDKLFNHACKVLRMKNITWRPMEGRTAPVNTAKDYTLGYTDLEKREITLDIFTPRRRAPKSANGLLRVIAHEIAHIQKPPYRQRYKGRMITRMHYPQFYKQVTKNVDKFKKDKWLTEYFRK